MQIFYKDTISITLLLISCTLGGIYIRLDTVPLNSLNATQFHSNGKMLSIEF